MVYFCKLISIDHVFTNQSENTRILKIKFGKFFIQWLKEKISECVREIFFSMNQSFWKAFYLLQHILPKVFKVL